MDTRLRRRRNADEGRGGGEDHGNHHETVQVRVPSTTAIHITGVMEESLEIETKVHPSPFYTILNINRISKFIVVLSAMIIALDHIQSVMSKPSPTRPSRIIHKDESVSVSVSNQGVIENVNGVLQRHRMGDKLVEEYEDHDHDDDHPIHIAFLGRGIDRENPFTEPSQPLDEYFDSSPSLPDDFRHFYAQAPDLETQLDIDLLIGQQHQQQQQQEEAEALEGHVYTEEDYLDDTLLDEPEWINFFAFDDDVNRSPREEEDGSQSTRCTRPSWYRQSNPTCNRLHETPILNEDEYYGFYLASGE